MYYKAKSEKGRKIMLVLSVILAAVTLFGALYWAPNHNQSTTVFWVIFALMVFQIMGIQSKNQ